jgi:hypothetical protein
LSTIATILSAKCCAAIEADFDCLEPAGNEIGMAHYAALYSETTAKTINRRLPVGTCLIRKILFEPGVFDKKELCDTAGAILIIVFQVENLCTVYAGQPGHLFDVLRKPGVEFPDDLALDVERDLVNWSGGVCH